MKAYKLYRALVIGGITLGSACGGGTPTTQPPAGMGQNTTPNEGDGGTNDAGKQESDLGAQPCWGCR